MSSQSVKTILLRAIFDDEFLQAMLNDPNSALTEYEKELTVKERQTLLENSSILLEMASTSSGEIAWVRGLPPLRIRWHYYEFAESSIYTELETVAGKRVQQAFRQVDDMFESVASLKALEPAEREQHLAELLHRWEQPDVQ